MTKGVGVGTKLLGEIGTGDSELVKPGMTRADLAAIETRGFSGPDPFGDVFNEEKKPASAPVNADGVPPPTARAPLPPQDSFFGGNITQTRAPLPPQDSFFGGNMAQAGPTKMGGFKVQLCTFWPKGECHKGEACTYAHGEADLRK